MTLTDQEIAIRNSAPAAGRAAADRLRESVVLRDHDSGDRHCGMIPVRLSADAAIPEWLRTVLDGADLTDAEGPWPGLVRTSSRIDWPALQAAHHSDLAVDDASLHHNTGIHWPDLVVFWEWLASKRINAAFDVELTVDVARSPVTFELFLYGLLVHADPDQLDRISVTAPLPIVDIFDCTCGRPQLWWDFG